MKRLQTTEKHFLLFKKYCLEYLKLFSIDEWDITFTHEDDDSRRAFTRYDVKGRKAIFTLTKEWVELEISDALLQRSAKHEVLHLLIAPLSDLAERRYVQESEILSSEHGIIEKLMKLLPDK